MWFLDQARAYKVGIYAASEFYARSAMITSRLRRAVCDPASGARGRAEPFSLWTALINLISGVNEISAGYRCCFEDPLREQRVSISMTPGGRSIWSSLNHSDCCSVMAGARRFTDPLDQMMLTAPTSFSSSSSPFDHPVRGECWVFATDCCRHHLGGWCKAVQPLHGTRSCHPRCRCSFSDVLALRNGSLARASEGSCRCLSAGRATLAARALASLPPLTLLRHVKERKPRSVKSESALYETRRFPAWLP